MEHIGEALNRKLNASGPASISETGDPIGDPDCEVCHGEGFEYVSMHPVTVVPCRCRQRVDEAKRQRAMLRYCQLPPKAQAQTFENFKTYREPSLVAARDAAVKLADGAEDLRFLTLMALRDHGKSHLAAAVAKRWLSRGVSAMYRWVPDLLTELKASFSDAAQYGDHREAMYDRVLNRFKTVPLLILDDLGTEKMTEWGVEQVQTIINARDANCLHLMVTTNKPMDSLFISDSRHVAEWQELATARVSSRLQRESYCKVVFIDGPEHRERSEK